MVGTVIQGMIGAIVGAIAFVAVRALVDGLTTTTWGSAEIVMIYTILPLAVAIMAVVVVFVGLMQIKGIG